MTFTDAELDGLQRRLASPPFGMDTSERLLIEAAASAITYLRAQLSKRDPIGAAIMRERCDVAAQSINATEGEEGEVCLQIAIVEAIHAIPLPPPAETLAYALQLPEVKALVDASEWAWKDIVKEFGQTKARSTFRELDVALHAIAEALAALEPKP